MVDRKESRESTKGKLLPLFSPCSLDLWLVKFIRNHSETFRLQSCIGDHPAQLLHLINASQTKKTQKPKNKTGLAQNTQIYLLPNLSQEGFIRTHEMLTDQQNTSNPSASTGSFQHPWVTVISVWRGMHQDSWELPGPGAQEEFRWL